MRLKELDSLRGIAAITVLLNHFIGVYMWALKDTHTEGLTLVNLFKYTPLHVLWYGHEAVILFFVLSGFVLALPFFLGKVNYMAFLTKRLCRIYIPYLVALIFSLFCFSIFNDAPIIFNLNDWFNNYWKQPLSLWDIVNSIFLIGYYDPGKINGPFWTLTHEMRIAIIFPFIMSTVVLKFTWEKSILIAAIISILSGFCSKYIPIYNFFSTTHYISMFIIGAVLAKNYKVFLEKYILLNKLKKICVTLAGISLFSYTWLFYNQKFLHRDIVNDWMIALGSAIIIIVVIANNKFLLIRPIKFLGDISYSLYLVHLPILLSVIHINNGVLPTWINLFIAFILTLVLSKISYLYIEKPSIKLGKLIVDKFKLFV